MNSENMIIINHIIDNLKQSVKANKNKVEEIRNKINAEGALSDSTLIELPTEDLVELLQLMLTEIIPKSRMDIELAYLDALLALQLAFYTLSDNANDNIVEGYRFNFSNCRELYDGMFDGNRNEVELTFKFDSSKPIVELLNELDRFNRIAKLLIQSSVKNYTEYLSEESKGLMPFFVFHKEVIGCEDKWRNDLIYYANCYAAYKGHFKDGVSRRKLIKILNLNEKDEPNSLKKVNIMLAEAKRLIASAEKGTFPY